MLSGIKEEPMESSNKNKHLVLDDRYEIQHGLNESLSFKAIGTAIGKDCTTISKEVKAHIIFVPKRTRIVSTVAHASRPARIMRKNPASFF